MEFGEKIIRSHEDLEVWQRGIVLVREIYKVTKLFPSDERFRLIDQMCRAAISIPSNIAEGSARKTTNEYKRYTAIALGSLAELRTQVVIASDLNYVKADDCSKLQELMTLLGKQLNALYNALDRK